MVRILKPYASKEGERNNFAYHLGGYFKKEGYSQTATEKILETNEKPNQEEDEF